MICEIAVILVAGIGSRLRPITDDRPKALVQVGDETILGRACRLLVDAGAKKIVLATGYQRERVWRATRGLGIEVVTCDNPEYATTQNSVSLALCQRAVEGESFVKLDGDVVFEPEVLGRLLRAPRDSDLLVLTDSKRERDEEAMKVREQDGRIVEFGKRIPLASAQAETIGIEGLSKRASDEFFRAMARHRERGERGLYYEDVYSELIRSEALSARAIEVGDLAWTEVDTLEDLERARALLGSASASDA
jgi:choline kinase